MAECTLQLVAWVVATSYSWLPSGPGCWWLPAGRLWTHGTGRYWQQRWSLKDQLSRRLSEWSPWKWTPQENWISLWKALFAGVAEITPAEGKLMQVRMTYWFFTFHLFEIYLPSLSPKSNSTEGLCCLAFYLFHLVKHVTYWHSKANSEFILRRNINAVFCKIICLFLTLVLHYIT